MIIAAISDMGSAGGAAIAATRLCAALRARGDRVVRLCRPDFPPDPASADEFIPMELRPRWLRRAWGAQRPEFARATAQKFWAREFERVLAALRPDVIHIHNLHGAQWDIEVVEACLRRAPVIWTLHDMWAFTGSCAYSYECRKFESECDAACPQAGVYPALRGGQIAEAHRRRRRLFASGPRLALVSPSRWLAEEARHASRGAVHVEAISNGLNLAIFHPTPRAGARAKLGLPNDGKPCLLAAAAALGDPRKGMQTLLAAFGLLADFLAATPVRLMLMGKGGGFSLPPGVEPHALGSVSGDAALARAYAAADLYVHPARADNQPLTVMESIASGTPVVALPVGGVPEMIAEGCGWLADRDSPEALAAALREALLARERWPQYAERCRAKAEAAYGSERQAEAYANLAERLRDASF